MNNNLQEKDEERASRPLLLLQLETVLGLLKGLRIHIDMALLGVYGGDDDFARAHLEAALQAIKKQRFLIDPPKDRKRFGKKN